jgi:hypothetical protein
MGRECTLRSAHALHGTVCEVFSHLASGVPGSYLEVLVYARLYTLFQR